MPAIAFTAVGCKLNRYEIQVMSEILAQRGFVTVPFGQKADCYVINSCSVTGDADYSSRQLIRRARRRSLDAKIVVTGCYAQLKPEELAGMGIDAVISNRDKDHLPRIILELFGMTSADDLSGESHIIGKMDGLTRAFVKIEDGCDDRCTFCAIWLARGPVKSRPVQYIVDETNALSNNGYKEIALTGVHIGKYSANGLSFVDLLRELIRCTSIDRIRLSSLNPREITPDLISLMSSEPRICPHVHLSIQSGDNETLKMMGRRYGREEVLSATRSLSTAIPGITIGADIIAAFPGETNEQFENTRRLIEEENLSHLHIFPYSDRPGTIAYNLPGKIGADLKASRMQKLRTLGQIKKRKHLENFVGKTLYVLFEIRPPGANEILTGLSENYLRVNARGNPELRGKIWPVIPTMIRDEILISRIIIGTGRCKKELTI